MLQLTHASVRYLLAHANGMVDCNRVSVRQKHVIVRHLRMQTRVYAHPTAAHVPHTQWLIHANAPLIRASAHHIIVHAQSTPSLIHVSAMQALVLALLTLSVIHASVLQELATVHFTPIIILAIAYRKRVLVYYTLQLILVNARRTHVYVLRMQMQIHVSVPQSHVVAICTPKRILANVVRAFQRTLQISPLSNLIILTMDSLLTGLVTI